MSRPAPRDSAPVPDGITNREYEALRRRVYGICRLDLDKYNHAQLVRRLRVFRRQLGIASLAEYADLLGRDPEELRRFTSWFAIHVSEFFRDLPRWQELETRFLPDLAATHRSLRIWSAGCSYGAEPYTLAILLAEGRPDYRGTILATDIDPAALAQARAGGPYTARDVRSLTASRVMRHFRRSAEDPATWWLNLTSIRPVSFETHDLLHDVFFADFDLIVCRNVIIYFTDEAKSAVFARFARALRPGGLLFIGGTEVISHAERFGLSRVGVGFYRS